MLREAAEYQENASFWTTKGDHFTVVGDWLGRKPAIELLAPFKGQQVLDAGCGQGIVTRRIAALGAEIEACDRDERMLQAAIAHEQEKPLGINYQLADITQLPYEDGQFDAVMCCAVLIHNSEEEVKRFFCEAHRVLKEGGELVVSVMHPHLYREGSPTRTGQAGMWQHIPLEEGKAWEVSQPFRELYPSTAFEKPFDSTVWHHTDTSYQQWLKDAGFERQRVQSNYMDSVTLSQINQAGGGRELYGSAVDYPAFWQIKVIKH